MSMDWQGPIVDPNPNHMNARCGLEDCDCEYTIGGLLRRLELIVEKCTAGLHPCVDKDEVFRSISWSAKHTVNQTRSGCDDTCPCFVAGCEAERRPLGA